MFKTRLIKMTTLGIKKFRDPYYHGFAAQLAFFYMLSLIPLALLLSQVLFYIFQTNIQEAVGWLFQGARSSIISEVQSLTVFRSAGTLNILYAVIALWAASRAQFALTRITNFTFSDGRTTGRGYFIERIRSLFTTLVTLLSIVAALLVMIFGSKLMSYFFNGTKIWRTLRWPVVFVLFVLIICFMFYVMPATRWKFRQLLPGAVFSAVGLLLVTALYSTWVDVVADYDIIYGALSNIVALMFWFYFFAWAICLGVLFNKLLVDTKDMEEIEAFDYAQSIHKLDE